MDFFNYHRRSTVDVPVGNLILGGNHRIAIQTMTNTSTLDTEASVAQCERIVAAGADLIRLTAQGVREAENLRNIKCELRKKGYTIPLSADIHFNPKAAETAAKIVEKVRINPGNFADRQKAFSGKEYSEEEYAQGIEHIHPHWRESRLVVRQNHESLRRHTRGYGGILYGIPSDSRGRGIFRHCDFVESIQYVIDDQGCSFTD